MLTEPEVAIQLLSPNSEPNMLCNYTRLCIYMYINMHQLHSNYLVALNNNNNDDDDDNNNR